MRIFACKDANRRFAKRKLCKKFKLLVMLGVRSQHDPVSGKFASEMMNAIIEMTTNPVENSTRGKYNFEWSDEGIEKEE